MRSFPKMSSGSEKTYHERVQWWGRVGVRNRGGGGIPSRDLRSQATEKGESELNTSICLSAF